jgi:hypothetical protein
MAQVPNQTKLSSEQLRLFVRNVAEELNKARTNPKSFIPILNEHRKYLDKEGVLKLPGRIPIKTHEGILLVILKDKNSFFRCESNPHSNTRLYGTQIT